MKTLRASAIFLMLVVGVPFAVAGPVNINAADAETISAELQGVGLSKAQAIVEYRKANGPFKSVDELMMVKGIGARTVEINRENILLQPVSVKTK